MATILLPPEFKEFLRLLNSSESRIPLDRWVRRKTTTVIRAPPLTWTFGLASIQLTRRRWLRRCRNSDSHRLRQRCFARRATSFVLTSISKAHLRQYRRSACELD